MLDVKKQY